MTDGAVDADALDGLIAEAQASGGSERANYQIFISGLCDVLGLPRPVMSHETNARNDYVYEGALDYRHPDGSATKLFVDCYRRGSKHFISGMFANRKFSDWNLPPQRANSFLKGSPRYGRDFVLERRK